ncbi:hypothetical protein ACOMICROBIO_LMKGKHOH_02243 [Vibrio sp. B1FIG11]|uniref:hypothetical protein n=1 Tax=Vibrio TaxID=662 RepID=UPI0006942E04|nr:MULTISPECIES: hypothetical protein [Vibrio]NDJ79948.1 hypothetical protein [Vibrio sp. LB10LO1]CAD7807206.1 hypothetical protein ACOMICROBIO_LMKGKHOH_02243 [Vibrio sp. B1FIG11]CAE6903702.1 hypothetical protein ACOMICROBIO_LMKGKHOH_02243 [Vibrio sp. B1FIG11]
MLKNIVILIFLMFSSSVIASTPRTELNLLWMKNNYFVIQEHLESDESKIVVPTINTLGEIWVHRDGAVSGEVSLLLLVALTHHTYITLAVLSSEPDSFSKWLNELQGIVFTDFNGGEVEQLSHAKEDLVRALSLYMNSNPQVALAPYGESLLERLEGISIRSVD